jgi:hypothetical protein
MKKGEATRKRIVSRTADLLNESANGRYCCKKIFRV